MFQQLKIALKISKFLTKHFDLWKWISPKELPHCKTFQHRKNYEFYYQRQFNKFKYFFCTKLYVN